MGTKQRIQSVFHVLFGRIQHSPRLWIAALALSVLLPIGAVISSYVLVSKDRAFILSKGDTSVITSKYAKVGIVLGAGITKDGKPFRELQSRLDVAADALQKGEVQQLILSGDNRFKGYDEPTAMKSYLVSQKHIAPEKLQPDFAGRSTYESCERAAKVFGVRKTIIFSAESHLPRAIYLCRHFGIEAYGVASAAEANNAGRREIVARVKAVFNVYVYGEHTVLGPAITL